MNQPANMPQLPIQKHHKTSPQRVNSNRILQHQPMQQQLFNRPIVNQQQQQVNPYNQVRFRTPQQRGLISQPQQQQQPGQFIIPQQQIQQQQFNNRLYTPSPQKQFFQARNNSLPNQNFQIQSPGYNVASHQQMGVQYQQFRSNQKQGNINQNQLQTQQLTSQKKQPQQQQQLLQINQQQQSNQRIVRPFYQQQQQQQQQKQQVIQKQTSPAQVKQTITQIVRQPSPIQNYIQQNQDQQQKQQQNNLILSSSINSRNSSGEKYVNLNVVSPIDEIQPSVNNSNQNSKHSQQQNIIGNLRMQSESPKPQNEENYENPNKLKLFSDSQSQNFSMVLPYNQNSNKNAHVRINSLDSNQKQVEQYQEQLSIKRLPTNQSQHDFQDVGKQVDNIEVDKKVNYLLDEIDLIQQLLSGKVQQNKELREYIKKLEKEIEQLKSEQQNANANNNQLNSSVSSHISDNSINQFAKKAEEYQNMIKNVLSQKSSMNEQVIALKQENLRLQDQIQTYKTDIEQQKNAYQSRISLLIEEIDTMNANLQQKLQDEGKVQAINQEKLKYQQKCSQLEESVKNLQDQLTQSQIMKQEEISSSLKQSQVYSSKCEQLENELKKAQEQFQQKEKELKNQVYTLSEQNIKKQQSLEQLSNTQNRVKQFEDQMQNLDLEMNRLRETTKIQQVKLQTDKQIIQDLELQIQDLQKNSNSQINQVIEENKILSQEITQTHQMLEFEKRENNFKSQQLVDNENIIQELMEYRNKSYSQQNNSSVNNQVIQEKDKEIIYWKNKFTLLENVIKKYNDIDNMLKQKDV